MLLNAMYIFYCKCVVTSCHSLFIFLMAFQFYRYSVFNLSTCILGRGGQSAQRFGRIREEKRHNFLRKVAETAVKVFIENDKINISGLILAGSAQFKVELSQTDLLDPVSSRYKKKVFALLWIIQYQSTEYRQIPVYFVVFLF